MKLTKHGIFLYKMNQLRKFIASATDKNIVIICVQKHIATWSPTERGEIRNFSYTTVFELTGRQRLTVKRGIMNVGQFLAAEVRNPGQNESQQMFALCGRMDKEGDILDRDSSPNESPDRVKEEERG